MHACTPFYACRVKSTASDINTFLPKGTKYVLTNLSKEEIRTFAADIMAAELSKSAASTVLSPSESNLSNCEAFFDNIAPSVTKDCLFKFLSYWVNVI